MSTGLSILQNLCTIIQTQLALDDTQVWVYDQKRKIPPTLGAWIVVRFLTGKPYGTSSRFDQNGTESQAVKMNSVMEIDIFSRDTSALDLKEQVVMAFSSIFAQQMCEKYAFKIGRNPVSFNDLSIVEGAAIPYRFKIGFQVQYQATLMRSVGYYDTFPNTLITEA